MPISNSPSTTTSEPSNASAIRQHLVAPVKAGKIKLNFKIAEKCRTLEIARVENIRRTKLSVWFDSIGELDSVLDGQNELLMLVIFDLNQAGRSHSFDLGTRDDQPDGLAGIQDATGTKHFFVFFCVETTASDEIVTALNVGGVQKSNNATAVL